MHYTHTHTHTHTNTHTHTHTRTRTRTHTHARTHARTHALTHAHTPTPSWVEVHTRRKSVAPSVSDFRHRPPLSSCACRGEEESKDFGPTPLGYHQNKTRHSCHTGPPAWPPKLLPRNVVHPTRHAPKSSPNPIEVDRIPVEDNNDIK